mmetsp:Transcript_4402/g.7587  ORF Transcript_4402/g.7587 Transcript_4402/m.7587 type:complete len:120 (-) Transcript_4402:190-549(-)
MAFSAFCFVLASCLAAADLAPTTTHQQRLGVQTCEEMGGTCSVPTDGVDGLIRCPDGFVEHEFEEKCDSGCGYWRGQCNQPCCVSDGDPQTNRSNINALSLLAVGLISVALVSKLKLHY